MRHVSNARQNVIKRTPTSLFSSTTFYLKFSTCSNLIFTLLYDNSDRKNSKNCFVNLLFVVEQILRPFTLAFTVSQNEGHGMRINVNIGDLCLNVSPRSIEIIQNSVQVSKNKQFRRSEKMLAHILRFFQIVSNQYATIVSSKKWNNK